MTAVLAIDLGTSQVKALCVGLDGAVRGQGTARYPIATPRDGWAESDPELWWRAVQRAVHEAAPAEVAAIGLAGQMHGVVLCSERHAVSRPAILWLDRRAEAEAARYESLTSGQRALLANAAWPGAAGPILMWLRARETAVYRPRAGSSSRRTGSASG